MPSTFCPPRFLPAMKRPAPEPSSPGASLSPDSSGSLTLDGGLSPDAFADGGVSPDAASDVGLSQDAPSDGGLCPCASSEVALSDEEGDSEHAIPPHLDVPPPVADSLVFGFTWPARVLAALRHELGDNAILRGLCCPPQRKASTHFTGLGTAELAVDMLNFALAPALRAQGCLDFAFACERSLALRRVLLQRAPSRCCFADLASRFIGLEDTVSEGRLDFDRAVATVSRAGMMHAVPCETHRSMCPVMGVQVDISGSPCTPWSRAVGATRLGREHPMTLLFLLWSQWVLSSKLRMAIHENVVGFDLELFHERLGAEHWVEHVRVSPADLGFPMCRRPRLYSIAWRKACFRKPPPAQALYDRVLARLAYRVQGNPFSWVTLATPEELAREENRMRRARGLAPVHVPSADWSYLLTDPQKRRLRQYKERDAAKRADVFDLGQNPGSGNEVYRLGLPTLRRGSSRLWLARGQRWLLPAELRAALGFPSYRPLADAARVDVDPSQDEARFATGNAMHVANVGAIIALASCMAKPV